MSELTLTVIRLGFLAVLWAFVLSVAGVMRSDLFGHRVSQRPATPRPSQAAKAPKAKKPPKPPRTQRGTPRVLVVTDGSLKGTELTLGQTPVTIGRAVDCTLVLDDDYASNRHARISPRGDNWVVEDLGSTNGTYLRNTRVEAPTVVAIGVPVRVGKTVVELRK